MAKIQEKTPEQLDTELKALEVEERRLRLEDLTMRVENERARRDQIARANKAQNDSLDDTNRQIRAQQKACRHRKGGKNIEGIMNGHDANYSVIKHTYPWGEVVPICSRCGKQWFQPLSKMQRTEDFAAYEAARKSDTERERQMEEYRQALAFPTDNEPSGSQIFLITRNAPPPARATGTEGRDGR